MPICPNEKCKKEITYLLKVELVRQYWKAELATPDEEGTEALHGIKLTEVDEEETFDQEGHVCPECNAKVCEEPEEAATFLKGGNV